MYHPTPIKISFFLTKEDYLQHLLYSASKTPDILRKRKRNRIILPVIYLSVGIFGFINGNMALFAALLLLAALWYSIFPKWEQKQYVNQYSKYLDTNLKDEIGKEVSLEFSAEHIIQTEKNQKFTTAYDQIRGWYETGQAVYIGLNDGYTIIIPKAGINHLAEIENIVLNNQDGITISQVKDLSWEWK